MQTICHAPLQKLPFDYMTWSCSIPPVKRVIISKFKAECIALLKQVQKSGEPLIVTLRGDPLATIHPAYAGTKKKQLGGQRGCLRIKTDLVRETSTEDWRMLSQMTHCEFIS